MLAQPPGSVDGGFKVTEQGEVIFARYGHPVIAERHLEQVASAVLLASAAPGPAPAYAAGAADDPGSAPDRFRQVAERMDAGALRRVPDPGRDRRIRRVVRHDQPARGDRRHADRVTARPPGASPAATGLDDLRAIPWVFAWAQTRVNLPGWFGLGSGLAAVADGKAGRAACRPSQDAYRDWPLLAVLLDNAEMSLAKTDRRIAARYLALGGREDLTALVLDEYDLTRAWCWR